MHRYDNTHMHAQLLPISGAILKHYARTSRAVGLACWCHQAPKEDVEVLPTFDALGLKEDLLRGVYAYGLILSLDKDSTHDEV